MQIKTVVQDLTTHGQWGWAGVWAGEKFLSWTHKLASHADILLACHALLQTNVCVGGYSQARPIMRVVAHFVKSSEIQVCA